MKDHEIAALVNSLRDVATTYGQTQQLRERIHREVVPPIKAINAENKQYREALEAIKKHQETMNQGDGPLKDRKLYEFTAAWNIAQKALDGDNNGI